MNSFRRIVSLVAFPALLIVQMAGVLAAVCADTDAAAAMQEMAMSSADHSDAGSHQHQMPDSRQDPCPLVVLGRTACGGTVGLPSQTADVAADLATASANFLNPPAAHHLLLPAALFRPPQL